MIKGIYIAGSGMLTQVAKLDTITNNLANVNSTGYKKDDVTFDSLPVHSPPPRVSRIQLVSAEQEIQNKDNKKDVLILQSFTDFSRGRLRQTDNPLDIALDGDGFLVVNTPYGNRYTRNGNLSINSQGILVTQDGFPVLGQNGSIKVGNGELEITNSGNVFVDKKNIDTLQIVDFPKPYSLKKEGNGLFALTDSNVRPNQTLNTEVLQGFIESSNVDVVNQMVKMIKTMRVYETHQKMVQSIDSSIQKTTSELGKA